MPEDQENNQTADLTSHLNDKSIWIHEYRRIDLLCWGIALATAKVTAVVLISLLVVWVGMIGLDVRFRIELDSPAATTTTSTSTPSTEPASTLTKLDLTAYMNWVGQSFGLSTPNTITPNGPLGTLSGVLVYMIFVIGGPFGLLNIRNAIERVKDDLPGQFKLKVKVVDMMYHNDSDGRKPREHSDKRWADAEKEMRKSCYSRHVSGIDEAFLNDSDMSSGYGLAIIYQGNARNFRVFASARFFSTASDIETELQDAKCIDFARTNWRNKKLRDKIFPNGVPDGQWCLVDRLANAGGLRTAKSGKTVKLQSAVFALLYKSILDHSPEATYFVGLARMGRNEQLLHRYIPFGLRILGVCDYMVGEQLKSHWVVGNNRADLHKFGRLQSVALRFIWRQNQ